MANFTSNGTGGGLYTASATWSGGTAIPGATDAINVVAGDTVFFLSSIQVGSLINSSTGGGLIQPLNGHAFISVGSNKTKIGKTPAYVEQLPSGKLQNQGVAG